MSENECGESYGLHRAKGICEDLLGKAETDKGDFAEGYRMGLKHSIQMIEMITKICEVDAETARAIKEASNG